LALQTGGLTCYSAQVNVTGLYLTAMINEVLASGPLAMLDTWYTNAEAVMSAFKLYATFQSVQDSGNSVSMVHKSFIGSAVQWGYSLEFGRPTANQVLINDEAGVFYSANVVQYLQQCPFPYDAKFAAVASVVRPHQRYIGNTPTTGSFNYPYPGAFIFSKNNNLNDQPTDDFITACGNTGAVSKQYGKNKEELHSNAGDYHAGSSFDTTIPEEDCLWQATSGILRSIGTKIVTPTVVKGSRDVCFAAAMGFQPELTPVCAVVPFALDTIKGIVDWTADKAQGKHEKKMSRKK